jgi:hypothetical protein
LALFAVHSKLVAIAGLRLGNVAFKVACRLPLQRGDSLPPAIVRLQDHF